MPRGGGSPGRRSEPVSIEASGTRKSPLSNSSTTCQASRRTRGARPSAPLVGRERLLISGFAPAPGAQVLGEHYQRGNAVEHPDHRRPVAEAEVLEGIVVNLQGEEQRRIMRPAPGDNQDGGE